MALDRDMYGDPMLVLERKQERALRAHEACGDCKYHQTLELRNETLHSCTLRRRYGWRCISFELDETMKQAQDFSHVEPHQSAVHDRLLNWARWVTPGSPSMVSPMFRQYRSHAWQWHTPEIRLTCDSLDAMAVEKIVAKLPAKHRDAVRWAYVHRCTPAIAIREMGVSYDGLAKLLRDGRQMLINLL